MRTLISAAALAIATPTIAQQLRMPPTPPDDTVYGIQSNWTTQVDTSVFDRVVFASAYGFNGRGAALGIACQTNMKTLGGKTGFSIQFSTTRKSDRSLDNKPVELGIDIGGVPYVLKATFQTGPTGVVVGRAYTHDPDNARSLDVINKVITAGKGTMTINMREPDGKLWPSEIISLVGAAPAIGKAFRACKQPDA
jgi:hypothetical protein